MNIDEGVMWQRQHQHDMDNNRVNLLHLSKGVPSMPRGKFPPS